MQELNEEHEPNDLHCDIAIVGGGAAGLWLLDLLSRRGYDVLLCEALDLGQAQTIASQGMIHGGIKYALGAALTGASEAIARMPDRWRRCLQGDGEVDLRDVAVVANSYHMWSDGKLGKLGSFFASHALRGRVEPLATSDYPGTFQTPEFKGTLHQLHDLVLDVSSLLHTLAAPHQQRLVKGRVTATTFDATSQLRSLRVERDSHSTCSLHANQFIFTAGAGNEMFSAALRDAGHSHAPRTQLRPLHQAFVQHPDLQPLYAHCITGIRRAEPRLTITTHALTQPTKDATKASATGPGIGWYIGGQLATEGVKRSTEVQIDVTRSELSATLPWINWNDAQISTLRIDRAEPRQHLGAKPDEACVVRCGNAMLCWPTKLSLVPDLGDQVVNAIDPPQPSAAHTNTTQRSLSPDAPPAVASPPWLS